MVRILSIGYMDNIRKQTSDSLFFLKKYKQYCLMLRVCINLSIRYIFIEFINTIRYSI